MLEREDKTETIERPWKSRYLPLDFADRAPTDRGRFELYLWLGENLKKSIKQEMPARQEKAEVFAKLLGRYSTQLYQLAGKKESYNEPNPGLPESQRKVSTPEQAEQRRIGMRTMLRDLGLSYETEILEDLFEQASAIPGTPAAGKLVEGKVVKSSSG